MKTQYIEDQNSYVERLQDEGLKRTAENLLHIMRPEVENLLERHQMLQPPSQSHRARRLLAILQSNQIPDLRKNWNAGIASNETRAQMIERFREIDILQYFLSVHRTVWILEGKPV